MTPDPKKMAEYLKELGPDKIAAALCAANAALAPLCKHHDDSTPDDLPPKLPTNMAGIAAEARNAPKPEGRGAAWA
jgi:hypothetical protein